MFPVSALESSQGGYGSLLRFEKRSASAKVEGNVVANVAVNVVTTTSDKLREFENRVRLFMLEDPHLTAIRLGGKLGITSRQTQRIIAGN